MPNSRKIRSGGFPSYRATTHMTQRFYDKNQRSRYGQVGMYAPRPAGEMEVDPYPGSWSP